MAVFVLAVLLCSLCVGNIASNIIVDTMLDLLPNVESIPEIVERALNSTIIEELFPQNDTTETNFTSSVETTTEFILTKDIPIQQNNTSSTAVISEITTIPPSEKTSLVNVQLNSTNSSISPITDKGQITETTQIVLSDVTASTTNKMIFDISSTTEATGPMNHTLSTSGSIILETSSVNKDQLKSSTLDNPSTTPEFVSSISTVTEKSNSGAITDTIKIINVTSITEAISSPDKLKSSTLPNDNIDTSSRMSTSITETSEIHKEIITSTTTDSEKIVSTKESQSTELSKHITQSETKATSEISSTLNHETTGISNEENISSTERSKTSDLPKENTESTTISESTSNVNKDDFTKVLTKSIPNEATKQTGLEDREITGSISNGVTDSILEINRPVIMIYNPSITTLKYALSGTFLCISLIAMIALTVYVMKNRRPTIDYEELSLVP